MKVAELVADSPYLCKEQLWDRVLTVPIDRIEAGHSIPVPNTSRKDRRNVLFFVGAKKGLVLNRTNSKFLVQMLGGNDTSEWRGQKITLYVDKSNKNPDGSHGGIRIAIGDRYSGKQGPARVPAPPPSEKPEGDWSEQVPSEPAASDEGSF